MLLLIVSISISLCTISTFTNGENVERHMCNMQATFYKVASNYSMTDARNISKHTTEGLLGCLDFCIELNFCKAFNFKKVKENDAVCELLRKDRTTSASDIIPRKGWSYYDTGPFMSQV